MIEQIRIGIIGYGNIGKAVEKAIEQNPDMELSGIFTRRDPSTIVSQGMGQLFSIADVEKHVGDIDVAILCGGSATDLPEQGPQFVRLFNTVDSYDTHARIPEYFAAVDAEAKKSAKTAVISTGWDPGLFSLMRVIEEAVLPDGKAYTFWGPGVSQGHSDAIRRIEGVEDGRQYTIPIESAVERVRSGEGPVLSTREKHLRDCYVVARKGADLNKIEETITSMPYYFNEYDTRVTFISKEEMETNHSAMPHGGFVMRTGKTADGVTQGIEFALKLGSNPGFTASVLIAYARAAFRLNREGHIGAKTVFDIAPGYLSLRSAEELRAGQL
ncbi:MAG: diaminopimelate dehydrogenase [Syntrophales bacterium]|nr:diaminopimelate dehydrogenase [Syntrophales bacterium]